jgi:hypothetical protein
MWIGQRHLLLLKMETLSHVMQEVHRMSSDSLYAMILNLVASNGSTAPKVKEHQAHVLFLKLVKQLDSGLPARLQGTPGYPPGIVSPLDAWVKKGGHLVHFQGHVCCPHMAVLDGESRWHRLMMPFLEASLILGCFGAGFDLTRLLSKPARDTQIWASTANWHTLTVIPAQHTLTMYYTGSICLCLDEQQCRHVPEPQLVGDSLLHLWNTYAPPSLSVERRAIREFLTRHATVTTCILRAEIVHDPIPLQHSEVSMKKRRLKKNASREKHPDAWTRDAERQR